MFHDVSVTVPYARLALLCVQVFQKEMFVRAVRSKSIRLFLEWFSETLIFDTFIDEKLSQSVSSDGKQHDVTRR